MNEDDEITRGVMQNGAAVVGAGPVGLTAALALARAGVSVTLIRQLPPPQPVNADNRTAALFAGSIALLKNLGVWDRCAPESAPLKAIRIVDDTEALLRAPEVLFEAREVGLDAFGYNVPNAVLVGALMRAAKEQHSVLCARDTAGVIGIDIGPDNVDVVLAEGSCVTTRLLVGADGRNSPSRAATGIGTRAWIYEQSALTCTFVHQRPHHDVSTEFHHRAGPLTTVPLPGNASALVWVERPASAARLAELDDEEFAAVLERRLQGLLGMIESVSPRALFPLSALTADAFAKNRVALVGEAAHVLPPIGAQGLNLGLRDAAVLADCIADAHHSGEDIGGAQTLARYDDARRGDVAGRVATVDILNRALVSSLLPAHMARGLGLHVLRAIGPLRRYVIREGLSPSSHTPRLMQSAP